MKSKFKFKNLFLISFAAIAGIFGSFAFVTSDNYDNNAKINNAKATDIYEDGMRVIYYYIDSNWQYGEEKGRRFEYVSGRKCHYYVYNESTKCYFGTSPNSDGSYAEVISDCAAKIFLPIDVESIYFGSDDGSNDNYKSETYSLFEGDGKEAFVLTSNESQTIATKKKQYGVWITKRSFFTDYLKYIYFTCSSAWIGSNKGPARLQDSYIYVSHTGSDGANIGRLFQLNDSCLVTLDGISGTFAKVLVSAKTGATVRFQKTYQTNPWNNYRSNTQTIPSGENNIVYVYGYTTGNSEQDTSTGSFFNKDDYLFFTPSSNWSADNAGFRICTYGANSAEQESYVAMQKLDVSVFGGLFTSSTVYYYKVQKPFYQVMFLRWDPNYMGSSAADKSTTHQWNYSGKCNTTSGKYWVNMNSSSWYDTWTTSDSSGVSWSTYGDLRSLEGDATGPSNNTTRIYFYNSGTHWASSGKCALRTWGQREWRQGLDLVAYEFKWFQDNDTNNSWYGYVDTPKTIAGCQIVKWSSSSYGANNSYYQSSADFDLSEGSSSCANAVLYGAAEGNAITKGGAYSDSAGSNLLSNVLSACNTCSDDRLSGFNSYLNLNNYYYSHAVSGAGSVSCKSMNSNTSYQIDIHFANLASRYANPSIINKSMNSSIFLSLLNDNESNLSTVVIIIASSVSLLSITALSILLVKKRSSNRKED